MSPQLTRCNVFFLLKSVSYGNCNVSPKHVGPFSKSNIFKEIRAASVEGFMQIVFICTWSFFFVYSLFLVGCFSFCFVYVFCCCFVRFLQFCFVLFFCYVVSTHHVYSQHLLPSPFVQNSSIVTNDVYSAISFLSSRKCSWKIDYFFLILFCFLLFCFQIQRIVCFDISCKQIWIDNVRKTKYYFQLI